MEPYTRTVDIAAGLLHQDVFREIKKERVADLLIGIPTYNNAATIGNVLQKVKAGLTRYFPDLKAVILNSDGTSTDGTVAIVRNSVTRGLPIYLSRHKKRTLLDRPDPLQPVPGKLGALQAIFTTAEELGVRACVVLEADLTSITPEWIERLVTPVINDRCDYVSPLYLRNKCDSMITSTFLYPLTRALYGKRVRQPIGGNFCVSDRLAGFYLRKLLAWAGREYDGIDIRLAAEAISKDYKMAQAFLGTRLRSNAGPSDVNVVLPRIAGTVFDLIEKSQPVWKSVRGSTAVPVFGPCTIAGGQQMNVEVDGMLAVFQQGVRDLKDIWMDVLGAADFGLLEYLAFREQGRFHITPTLWTSIVYSYALAYHKRKLSTGHLLKSLVPIYLGKAASYLLEIADKGPQEAEAEIERICRAFEDGKDHLARNWRD